MAGHNRVLLIRWLWVALLLVAAGLLLYDLQGKSLWVDELFTIQVAGSQDLADLIRTCIEAERRPPLYFLLLHYWMGIAGDGEMAVRLPSVFFALLAILLLGRLARAAGTGKSGLYPAAVLALMPTFVMYSRMSRAYSMNVALALVSTILFVQALKRPSPRLWTSYIIAAIVLLYTDYALIGLLLAQNLYVGYLALVPWRGEGGSTSAPHPNPLPIEGRERAWLVAQMIIALAFVPWLAVVAIQVQRGRLEADFAHGLSGYLLKLAYPVLSLGTGETIFPWQPPAILGLLAVAILFVLGLIALARRSRALVVLVLVLLVTPFLFTAVLLSSVATDITFINMASRTLFAAPFCALILAAGIVHLRVWPWRLIAIVILIAAWAAALSNYYTNHSFHNPIYAVPMRQIAEMVVAETQAGDIIVSDVDSGFGYYYVRSKGTAPHFSSFTEGEAAKQAIEATSAPRVWLMTLGRDRTRVDAPGELFAAWLDSRYYLAESRGYAREDERYRRLKEMLLKRPDYEYKALVRLYLRR